ncbi:uncharacterized protein LOC128606034 [Ictalurus furcatus]|uniref:uncharacterized protein LOC128606034 n=1 Tax=Ictalurus furcatus TaxID=66913 RepID=UPI002350BB7C|nr:uncharacterized protein LOC128606034 [Ictalurus furcatus]
MPQELLTALERTMATLELGRDEQQPRDRPLGAPGPRADRPSRPRTWRTRQRSPVGGTPLDEPMPTEPEREPARPPSKPWLAGCALHLQQPPEAPSLTVWVEGNPVTALLDTGSTVTLARPSILPKGRRLGGVLTVTCVHGDTREVPAAEVQIQGEAGVWPLQVGLIPELLVPLLLGRDWPGFPMGPTAEPQRPRQRTKRRGWRRDLHGRCERGRDRRLVRTHAPVDDGTGDPHPRLRNPDTPPRRSHDSHTPTTPPHTHTPPPPHDGQLTLR